MTNSPRTAAILSIGTELTRGEITNTNQSWLASELTALGLEVSAAESVADTPSDIIACLRRLGAQHRLIISTGGLGPTTDDLTSATVAEVLGVPLQRDPAALAAITERLARYGRELSESNASQADFPRGSEILPNSTGTAPGFAVDIGRARAFFLPGVPSEMRPMFTDSVAPFARGLTPDTQLVQVRLRSFGLPESQVNDLLSGVEEEFDVTLAYRAHFPEIEVKVLARRDAKLGSDSKSSAAHAARAAADAVKLRLGNAVYGEGAAGLPEVVGQLLLSRGLKLVTAESCTGGLVSELVTDVAGSSAYFTAAAVTYSNASKQALLGVSAESLERHGAVSETVVREMALGALAQLGGDVSIAITGIAGPSGGTEAKPVGLVHFAVATAAGAVTAPGEPGAALPVGAALPAVTARHQVFRGDRSQVRTRAAWEALALLRQVLLVGHD